MLTSPHAFTPLLVRVRSVGVPDPSGDHGGHVAAFLPALGFSGHSFAAVAAELREFRPQLLVDLPEIADQPRATGDEIVASVAAALARFRGARIVLVGHSIGGAIAVRLVGRLRFPVAALVLVDAAAAPFPLSWWERLVLHPHLWAPIVRLAGARRAVHVALPYLLREPPIADGWDLEELSRQLANPRRRRTMLAYYRAFLAPDELAATEADLARVHVPVLVLRGERDHVVPNTVMRHIVQHLPPGARVATRTLARAGHLLPLERPAAVAHDIDAFISTLHSGGKRW